MRIHWQGTIEVAAPCTQLYAYLADFNQHHEWSQSLERMDQVREGDASGVGARFVTRERLEFGATGWQRWLPFTSAATTRCEVRELVPDRRIAWRAHPIPRLGSAVLSFDLVPSADGGTTIRQTVDEFYPVPVAFMLRKVYNITEDGIRQQLDRGLQTLKLTCDGKRWEADVH